MFVLRNADCLCCGGVEVQGVVIVPGGRMDVLWLDDSFAMNYWQWTQLMWTRNYRRKI